MPIKVFGLDHDGCLANHFKVDLYGKLSLHPNSSLLNFIAHRTNPGDTVLIVSISARQSYSTDFQGYYKNYYCEGAHGFSVAQALTLFCEALRQRLLNNNVIFLKNLLADIDALNHGKDSVIVGNVMDQLSDWHDLFTKHPHRPQNCDDWHDVPTWDNQKK